MKMTYTQRMLLLIFAVCAAPFVGGTIMYFVKAAEPAGRINYGTLLETKPVVYPAINDLNGKPLDRESFKGKWWIVHTCGADCTTELYTVRQARTMLHKDKDRVERIAIVPSAPSEEIKAQNPGVRFVVAQGDRANTLAADRDGIMLIDPLGNQILLWPKLPDAKRVHKDMARLMRASRIG
jgi:hypothetical protein